MVGGGIGVTPYASILNDLVFGTSTNRYSGVACKKVKIYFPAIIIFKWHILIWFYLLGIFLMDMSFA